MANDKGTTVYALQKKFQSVFGFTLPLFHGRGLLNCEIDICVTHALIIHLLAAQTITAYYLTDDALSQLVSALYPQSWIETT